MKKDYSKVYKAGAGHYRYNYKKSVLEYIYKNDYKEWEAIDCQGLDNENWEENPQYWCDLYNDENQEEMKILLQYL